MNKFNNFIKLTKYQIKKYANKISAAQQSINIAVPSPKEIIKENEIVTTLDREFIAAFDQDKLLEAITSSYRLITIDKLIKGSQLAFNLHDQQRKTFKEFTPEHSRSITILAKINQNLILLREEEHRLIAKTNDFQLHYKKFDDI